MVKKLMKYELASYMRSLLPFQLILLGIALLHRFVQLFENDGNAYWTFFSSSTAIFIIACIVTLVATVALCIARFYKNMFTGEGYLSFTLPVTVHQHIWAKLLSAIICALVSVVAILLACSIVTAGDAFVELWKAICYLCNRAFDNIGGHFIAYIVEAVIMLVVVSAVSMLLFYTCIAVGQLAKKNRVLLAFGVFFGYFFACQILGTIAIIILTTYGEQLGIYKLLSWIENNSPATDHLVAAGLIVFNLILGTIYYLITQHIMKKKLNLE